MNTFPTDKNTYLTSDTVIRQTDCQYTFGKDSVVFSLRFLGDVTEATQLAAAYREGTRVSISDMRTKFSELSVLNASSFESTGKVTSSICTTATGSGRTAITVSIPYSSKISLSSDPDEKTVVTWSEKSTDYEFPIEIYAGEGTGSDEVNAGNLEAWKAEKTKNIENYKSFKFTAPSLSAPVDLAGRTLECAKKIYAGVESVKRAYPEVVRTTVHYNVKGNEDTVDRTVVQKIDEDPDLYYIDDTPNAVWQDKFPDFSWVKAAYDVQIEATEYAKFWNATVTESWIGIDKNERGAWDSDLYGADGTRWKFATAVSAS